MADGRTGGTQNNERNGLAHVVTQILRGQCLGQRSRSRLRKGRRVTDRGFVASPAATGVADQNKSSNRYHRSPPGVNPSVRSGVRVLGTAFCDPKIPFLGPPTAIRRRRVFPDASRQKGA